MRQKGFAPIILLILIGLGFLAYFGLFYKSGGLIQPTTEPTSTPVSETSFSTPDPMANWKIYTNTQYDFSFKYPSDWRILDMFGGPLMIAPISDVESVKATFDQNVSEGGYEGGKQLISLLSITEGKEGPSSDQYWNVIASLMQIDNKSVAKYVLKNTEDIPNGKYVRGDMETEVLFQLKNNFVLDYTLLDQRYESTYNQILSTFKFTQ